GLPVDGVAPVAGIPLEGIVAVAHAGRVVALIAVDEVVVVAAQERVGAIAAEDGVVAGAAVDGEINERGKIAGGRERVVAVIGVEHQMLGGADVEGERLGSEAVKLYVRPVGSDDERFVAAVAIDLRGVGAVAALEPVVAAAGIPDQVVVAAFAVECIVA